MVKVKVAWKDCTKHRYILNETSHGVHHYRCSRCDGVLYITTKLMADILKGTVRWTTNL